MRDPILTITPNPSLDISGVVDELVPNEKSYVYAEKRQPGGNGVNAGIMARNLGAKVIVTGFLGGDTGREYSELLKKIKLQQDFVFIGNRTRSNITVAQEKTHQQTRLSFPGPKISKNEIKHLMKKIHQGQFSQIMVGGSLPPGISSHDIVQLIKLGRKLNIPVVIDVPGHILAKLLKARPFFIKPNLTEFQELIGKKVSGKEAVIREAMKLIDLIPIICVSSVDGGALLITKNEIVFGIIKKVKVRSTVGAGDSMVGAITYFMNKHKIGTKTEKFNLEEMLRWGLAASAATLSNTGLQIGNKKDVLSYLSKVEIEKVSL